MPTDTEHAIRCLSCLRETFPEHVHLRCPNQDHQGHRTTVGMWRYRRLKSATVSREDAFLDPDLPSSFREYRCDSGEGCFYVFHCPWCSNRLELSLSVPQGTRLFMLVGPQNSGKSVFLGATWLELEIAGLTVMMYPPEEESIFRERVLEPLRRNKKPQPTLEAGARPTGYSACALHIPNWDVLLPVLDSAGEDYGKKRSQEGTETFEYRLENAVPSRLRQARGMLVMVDPDCQSNLARYTGANADYNYDWLIQTIHASSHTRPGMPCELPLCLVITKTDKVTGCRESDADMYPLHQRYVAEQDEVLRALLRDSLHIPEVSDRDGWRQLRHHLEAVSERFCSAISEAPLNMRGFLDRTKALFSDCAVFPVQCMDVEADDGAHDDSPHAGSFAARGVLGPLLWVIAHVLGQ